MTATTTNAGTLKPCPFCGGEAAPGTIRYSDHHAKRQGWDQTRFFFVNCMSCGAQNQGIVGRRTPEAARDHWNRRVEGAVLSGEAESASGILRDALEKIASEAPIEEPEYDDWGGDTEDAERWGLAAGAYPLGVIAREALEALEQR